MASYHMSAKIGKSGTGAAHADYIEREGKYASKEKDDLEHAESGNLPAWAETSSEFWSAADKYERANGSVYREFEVALPRELSPEQRLDLVREFVEREIGNQHTYTFAIHNPKAAIDGGEQPHAHIMFSERKLDGIDRTAEQHFKRYNAKTPERGGCQKASGGKTKDELKASLLQTRKGWADLQNKHLTRHGHAVQVTHLSLAAQGIQREVEPHLGPSRAKEYAQAVRNDRSAAKTPDVPKPQAVNVESVLRAYGYIKGALEKVTAEQKARETAETQKLDAAKAQAKDSEGLGGVLVHQIQQLGKRPMLMSGKWDAQDKALRAQFAEAKQANQQARERLKESQKRLDDLKAANTLDMRVKRAIESLDMPYTQKTLDVMQLGAKITQERQQAQEQAKAQEKQHQKAPDKAPSR
jgi:hypothetical protein